MPAESAAELEHDANLYGDAHIWVFEENLWSRVRDKAPHPYRAFRARGAGQLFTPVLGDGATMLSETRYKPKWMDRATKMRGQNGLTYYRLQDAEPRMQHRTYDGESSASRAVVPYQLMAQRGAGQIVRRLGSSVAD